MSGATHMDLADAIDARDRAEQRVADMLRTLREVAALVESPGSRTEREVDAIREVVTAHRLRGAA